jgi:hypothetical protein
MARCDVDDCPGERYGKKPWCEKHYRRHLRTGDPRGDPSRHRTQDTCSVERCPNPHDARGLCHGHLQRLYRNGDVQPDIALVRRKQPDECLVERCRGEPYARGLCQAHYRRLMAHGDPRPDLPIRFASGEGWVNHGYRYLSVPPELRHLTNGETKMAEHRLVVAMHLGRPLTSDEVVHHINGSRQDNRLENLELWSTMQPKGQRVGDKVVFALELLRRYQPDWVNEDAVTLHCRESRRFHGKCSPDGI